LYGADLYKEVKLKELLEELVALDGDFKIRLLYTYLDTLPDAVIDFIAREDKMCKYFDIPLQHASTDILKKMSRFASIDKIKGKLDYMRKTIPDLTLRTTFIVGFPGETEDDYNLLSNFIQDQKFDHMGAFPYSKEEGTPAYSMPNQISEEIKNQRHDDLMRLQQDIVVLKHESKIGKKVRVLIDSQEDENLYIARNDWFMPVEDGVIYVEATDLTVGEFIDVEIIGVDGYDLISRLQN